MRARGSQAMASEPVELTDDPAFARRIIRLALTSSIALGLVWLMMPSILFLSLRRPRLRYALAIPSTLVGVPLLIICASYLPEGQLARTGWLLLTTGILNGGVLGAWFWFRWLPVPRWLHAPFSPSRWALVGLHVALVVSGLVLVGVSTLQK